MGFLSKIGKALGKGLKKVGKAIGGVAQFAAPIAAMIPGVGTAVSAGLGLLGGVLGPKPPGEAQPFNVYGGYGLAAPSAPAAAGMKQVSPSSGLLPIAALGLAAFLLLR